MLMGRTILGAVVGLVMAVTTIMLIEFAGRSSSTPSAGGLYVLLWVVCGAFSLWIWHRFVLWYALPMAMVFALQLPGHWTTSRSAQHVIVAAFFTAGLAIVARFRPRHHLDYLNAAFSIAEALLWLGFYVAINLQLSSQAPGTQKLDEPFLSRI